MDEVDQKRFEMNSQATTALAFTLLFSSIGRNAGAIEDTFQLPDGTIIEQVAGAPLVEFPMFACFDDEGRLYVAEGSGKNISGKELEKSLPFFPEALPYRNTDQRIIGFKGYLQDY